MPFVIMSRIIDVYFVAKGSYLATVQTIVADHRRSNQCPTMITVAANTVFFQLLYSQKYWWELYLAVGSQIATAKVLVDLNLAIRYRITIRIYASKKFWADFNLAVAHADRQTAKFNSLLNFSSYTVWLLLCHSEP